MNNDYKNEIEEITKSLNELNKEYAQSKKQIKEYEEWDNIFENFINIKELNKNILHALVNKIEITEKEGEIGVFIDFKHANPFIEKFEYEHNTHMGRHNIGTHLVKVLKQGYSNIAKDLGLLYHINEGVN